jgi:hypothetical protein
VARHGVEAANVLQDEVTLGAGDAHSVSTRYAIGHPA